MSDKTPTGLGREPAPSSPDRIRAVVVALEGGIPWASMWQQASAAVDALDAYDREHGRG